MALYDPNDTVDVLHPQAGTPMRDTDYLDMLEQGFELMRARIGAECAAAPGPHAQEAALMVAAEIAVDELVKRIPDLAPMRNLLYARLIVRIGQRLGGVFAQVRMAHEQD